MSVVIPFHQRHSQLHVTLAALSRQTLDRGDFEVIVSVYGNDDGAASLASRTTINLRVIQHDGVEWNVAKARNAGIAAATGKLLLFLDSDIALQPESLALHTRVHQRHPRTIAAGAVRGYLPYEVHPFAQELATMQECVAETIVTRAATVGNTDPRWALDLDDAPLPWALCWSGNLSVPRAFAEAVGGFNQNFVGWGAEDLEFAYRVTRRGATVRFDKQAWGVHLPHPRSVDANVESECANFRRFVHEHPCFEVEVVGWLNELGANHSLLKVEQACRAASPQGRTDWRLAVSHDHSILRIGLFGLGPTKDVQVSYQAPLLGLLLPFKRGSVGAARLAPWISALPDDLRKRIEQEAMRVSAHGYKYGDTDE